MLPWRMDGRSNCDSGLHNLMSVKKGKITIYIHIGHMKDPIARAVCVIMQRRFKKDEITIYMCGCHNTCQCSV